MEERRRVHRRCHSQLQPLSLLLTWIFFYPKLHTNYITRKEKPKLQRIKTRLNPNLPSPPFSVHIMAFYRQKPNHQDPGEVGGVHAPPNSPRLPRKRGPSRVSAARVWPDGHILLVGLSGGFFWLYPLLVLSFELRILTKWPWIFGFNRSILREFFSNGFNLLILPWFCVCEFILI